MIDFHKLSERANRESEVKGINHVQDGNGEEVIACAEDFDGNMIEARYSSYEICDAEKDANRVLNWQEEVARSVSGDGSAPGGLKRADTWSGRERERPEPERRQSGGISRGTVIGTLLGAAAGAAIAYAMVRSESPEPVLPRASPPPAQSSYSYHRQEEGVVERVPARSSIGRREEDVLPRYVERYTNIPPPTGPRELETIKEGSYVSTRSRGRENRAESHYERPLQIMPVREKSPGSQSHVSRRSHRSSGSSRSKKEGDGGSEVTVKPATVYHPAQSHVSSKSKRSVKGTDGETVVKVSGSKVSVRPSQVALPETVIEGSRSGKSRSGRSKVGRSRVGEDHPERIPLPESVVEGSRSGRRRKSHRSRDVEEEEYHGGAERVELPESVVGGGNYEASVAPSDSVSCVGSKMERMRLVERMRARYVVETSSFPLRCVVFGKRD